MSKRSVVVEETAAAAAAPEAAESSSNATPAERDVFAGETEAELDALIEGRDVEETAEEAQPEAEEESSRQQELLSQEAALKRERRERLKRARDIRFRTGESETSIPKRIERQLQQDISLENNLTKHSISSTRVPKNADSADEIEVDLLLSDDWGEEEEEEIVQQPLRGADPIKAKMEFLQFFEIPSLSDISEDFDDAADAATARPLYNTAHCLEEEGEEEEGEEGEEQQAAIRSIAGGDSIRAKMDFLSHFAIPSLSDMSED